MKLDPVFTRKLKFGFARMLRNRIQFSRGLHAFQINEVTVMQLLEKFVLLLRNLFSKISVLT